jgi:hypothetical protein
MPAGSSTPNIVFVHVDQMRHDAIAALGNPHLRTPNVTVHFRAMGAWWNVAAGWMSGRSERNLWDVFC